MFKDVVGFQSQERKKKVANVNLRISQPVFGFRVNPKYLNLCKMNFKNHFKNLIGPKFSPLFGKLLINLFKKKIKSIISKLML